MPFREVPHPFFPVSLSGPHSLCTPLPRPGSGGAVRVLPPCSLSQFSSVFPSRLGNNHITAAGAEVLAQGLRTNNSLQFLG